MRVVQLCGDGEAWLGAARAVLGRDEAGASLLVPEDIEDAGCRWNGFHLQGAVNPAAQLFLLEKLLKRAEGCETSIRKRVGGAECPAVDRQASAHNNCREAHGKVVEKSLRPVLGLELRRLSGQVRENNYRVAIGSCSGSSKRWLDAFSIRLLTSQETLSSVLLESQFDT